MKIPKEIITILIVTSKKCVKPINTKPIIANIIIVEIIIAIKFLLKLVNELLIIESYVKNLLLQASQVIGLYDIVLSVNSE